MIYFDNNSTTLMSVDAKKSMLEWCNRGNPSSGYASARESRKQINEFRNFLGQICSIDVCCPEERDTLDIKITTDTKFYKVIFTSGASEANCTILGSVIDAYNQATDEMPHVVISAIEHKSLLQMAESYEKSGKAMFSYISPTVSGHINPQDVANAIIDNTCLVCIMHANNETGAINNIREIGRIAHCKNIPFHCDTVQTFGKFQLKPLDWSVDSFCVSFHKFGGPPGIGALIIKQKLLLGYHLQPMIFGTQNEGFRGGTENLPGIGASFTATRQMITQRVEKNKKVMLLRNFIVDEIAKVFPMRSFADYMSNPSKQIEIILLSGVSSVYLHNTILLSVVKPIKPYICNGTLKLDLEKVGIIVSVGSACNTSSKLASHVLYAMRADEVVRKGALRITLGDLNTLDEAKTFVKEFCRIVKKQISD